MTFQDFLTVLVRRWWLVGLGAVLGAGLGLVYESSQSPVVETEGRLLIGPALDEGLDLNDSTAGLSRGTLQQTLAELATGTQVTEAARERVENESPAYVIRSAVIPETNVVRITVEGPNGTEATALAGEVMSQVESSFEGLYPVYDVAVIDEPRGARKTAPNPTFGAMAGFIVGVLLVSLALVVLDSLERDEWDTADRGRDPRGAGYGAGASRRPEPDPFGGPYGRDFATSGAANHHPGWTPERDGAARADTAPPAWEPVASDPSSSDDPWAMTPERGDDPSPEQPIPADDAAPEADPELGPARDPDSVTARHTQLVDDPADESAGAPVDDSSPTSEDEDVSAGFEPDDQRPLDQDQPGAFGGWATEEMRRDLTEDEDRVR